MSNIHFMLFAIVISLLTIIVCQLITIRDLLKEIRTDVFWFRIREASEVEQRE